MFGGKPARGLPTHATPHLSASRFRTFYMWWTAKTASARFTCENHSREGGRAGWFAKRCHLIMDHRIDCKLKTKIANTILLLCYLDKICLTLTGGCGKLWRIYIVEGGYKREPEPVASPQLTILHSTGNTSVKKEVGHSNTRGTQGFVLFPLKLLLHIVYIFNILCGLKVTNSRRLQ